MTGRASSGVWPVWCGGRRVRGGGEGEMSGTDTPAAPSGGVRRMSRRVMNLAHFLTQNARRHGDRVGFICGDRSWTWREIDGLVTALAAALAARGIGTGGRIPGRST